MILMSPAPVETEKIELFTDGGSRGNPGPAAIGVYMLCHFKGGKRSDFRVGAFIGNHTNNEAEYLALIRGLEMARAMNSKKVIVYNDSEVVSFQMQGLYRVKNERLRNLYHKALSLVINISAGDPHRVTFNRVPRSTAGITVADAMANHAMDEELKYGSIRKNHSGREAVSNPSASSRPD